MAKYLDTDGLSHLWAKLKTLFSGKVDKVEGKGLSSNDYTTDEKNKLEGIEKNANKYEHPTVGTAGTYGDTGDARTLAHSGTFKVVAVTTDANGHVSSVESKTITLPAEYVLPDATTTVKGGVTVGDGLSVSSGKVSVATAPKLGTERTISMTGDVTGSVSFDGSKDVSMTATVEDDSHNHIIDNVDGLQAALDAKLETATAESTYAKKSDITNMYRFKGSKPTVDDLPSSGNTAGDVWNVEASGMNYAWTGTAWDSLGEIFKIDSITNTEIDTICV